jgi:histidyl-tRNA synthetase
MIFKILKRGEGAETGQADLALRYDVTVPLARVVAEYRAKLPKFFKRYQIQPVWRADRPQKGRFREFFQCDVDAIGSKSMLVEAELLSAASDVFVKLGFTNFAIHLNHRKLLSGLLTGASIPPEKHGEALVAIDKLDKIGPDGVRKELAGRGFNEDVTNRLMSWAGVSWRNDWLDFLAGQFPLGQPGLEAVDELREIVRLCAATSAGPHIRIEPSLARGLSYYTGPIFEIRVPEMAGSVAGGGRYDNLIGMFSGQDVPACGISLGLERILVVMSERQMFPDLVVGSPADVMVTVRTAERQQHSLRIASSLRTEGLRVEVYPALDKLGKQLQYASVRKIRYAVITAEDTQDESNVSVKNVETGKQDTVELTRLPDYLKRRLLNSTEEPWAIIVDHRSVTEESDDAKLCIRLGMAANAIGAAQRFYWFVRDARGPAGERDRSIAFVVAVGFVHEALQSIIRPNFERVRALAVEGGATIDAIEYLDEFGAQRSPFGELIRRMRNKVGFHWDEDVVQEYIDRLEVKDLEWAEGIGQTQGESLFALSADALTNSLLPDDEPNADDARNLQRLRELLEGVVPAMKNVMLICQYAVMGHLNPYSKRQEKL